MTDTKPADRRAVIIEDDPEIADLLTIILAQAGFRTFAAVDGDTGLDLIRAHDPMLTTLDVNLPGIDGFEVVKRIRSFSSTYVIMLSARRDEIDTLTGLNAGADDYVAKPLRPRELRARIEAMLRRREREQPLEPATPATDGSPDEPEWLTHNGLRLNREMRLVEIDDAPVELTRTEFDLLSTIMQGSRRVITKDELAGLTRNDLTGYVLDADRRSIESHMANLRRKLSDSAIRPRFIETVRGVGYRLAKRAD